MKNYFILILLVVGFWGCSKKELPADIIGEVVFKFEGMIGTDSVKYEAGKDGMYMNTGFFKDNQNLMTLRSMFAQAGCDTACASFLSFELKDIDSSSSAGLVGGLPAVFTSNTFYSYSLDSIVNVTQTELFNFNSSFTSGQHFWDFGDGSTSTLNNASHTYSSGGLKNILHVVTFQGNTDSINCELNTDINSTCRPFFDFILDTTSQSVSVTSLNNPASSSISWTFGNGATGNGITSSTTYNTSGLYTISMNLLSSACTNLVFRQKINLTGNPNYPVSNFSYNTSLQNITNTFARINKSAFIISWKNNGKVYKSFKNEKGLNQSGNPIFTVTSIGPYQNNEKGEKTIKLTGNVDTYLYNQSNSSDSIKIISNNLVVAAAYP